MGELTTLERQLINSIASISTRKGFYVSIGTLPKDTLICALREEVMMLVRTRYAAEQISTALRRLHESNAITYGTNSDGGVYFNLITKK